MDVSNSTGQNTSYRVLGGGSAPKPTQGGRGKEKDKDRLQKGGDEPKLLRAGTLEPNTYVTLRLPKASACRVQFLQNDKVIAQQEVEEGKGGEVLVVLVQNGEGAPQPYVCRKA